MAPSTQTALGLKRVSIEEALVEVGADGRVAYINGIETFPSADGRSASQAKRYQRKHNGVLKVHFELFLKECGFCINCDNPREQVRTLTDWHLHLG